MQLLISNTQTAKKLFDTGNRDRLTPYPKPKRFQLAPNGSELRVDMQELPNIQTTFLSFRKPGASFHPHRELAIEETMQLCHTLAP